MTLHNNEQQKYKFKPGDMIVNIESKSYFVVSKINRVDITLYVTSSKEYLTSIRDMIISKKRLVEQLQSDKGKECLRLYKMVPNDKARKKNKKPRTT